MLKVESKHKGIKILDIFIRCPKTCQSKVQLGRQLFLCAEIANKETQANMEKIPRKYRESDLYLSCCRNTLGRKYIVKTLSTNLIGGRRRAKSGNTCSFVSAVPKRVWRSNVGDSNLLEFTLIWRDRYESEIL